MKNLIAVMSTVGWATSVVIGSPGGGGFDPRSSNLEFRS